MRKTEPLFKNAEVYSGGGKFYPTHLTDCEIESIIRGQIKWLAYSNDSRVKAYFRKDRGGKGIDIRIDVVDDDDQLALKARRYSFGINANWDVVDFFDHWAFYSGGKDGQPVMNTSCEEILIRCEIGIEEILEERRECKENLERNSWFEKDDWVCLIPTVFINKQEED